MAEKLKFYDLRKKKAFMTDKYKFVMKKGRRYAVTTAPSGCASWRIVGSGKSKKK